MTISIRSLYSGYGKHEVIRGVDFDAKEEITVIIGANGSGKSTLLKSIIGMCDVTAGTVSFYGKDITGAKPHNASKMGIRYMPQTNNVFGDLSVAENLQINESESDAFEIFPMLRRYSSKKARQLSGGERQMLAMAMTLLTAPKTILFDEPTAALSPKNIKLVHNKIMEIRDTLGICIIMVEQNAKAALSMSDTAYLLAGGKVSYSGEPQNLLLNLDEYLGVK